MRKRVGHGGIGRCRQLHVASQRQKMPSNRGGGGCRRGGALHRRSSCGRGWRWTAGRASGRRDASGSCGQRLIDLNQLFQAIDPDQLRNVLHGIGLRCRILILNLGDQQRQEIIRRDRRLVGEEPVAPVPPVLEDADAFNPFACACGCGFDSNGEVTACFT